MKLETAIQRIKSSAHDISDEYSRTKCIEFLNNAIQQVASLLIAGRYPALVQEVMVRDGDTLPKNFSTALGTYPLKMTNGRAEIIDDDVETVRFRYFATPPLLEEATESLPFTHDGINEVVVRAAIILALNENEYDVSQDSNLLGQLQQALAGAMVPTIQG